jgi:hypothetical protein
MQLRTRFRTADHETDPPSSIEAGYARWRKETAAVARCFRDWTAAPRSERFLAYSAYLSALDREERAASVYRRLLDRAGTSPRAR